MLVRYARCAGGGGGGELLLLSRLLCRVCIAEIWLRVRAAEVCIQLSEFLLFDVDLICEGGSLSRFILFFSSGQITRLAK